MQKAKTFQRERERHTLLKSYNFHYFVVLQITLRYISSTRCDIRIILLQWFLAMDVLHLFVRSNSWPHPRVACNRITVCPLYFQLYLQDSVCFISFTDFPFTTLSYLFSRVKRVIYIKLRVWKNGSSWRIDIVGFKHRRIQWGVKGAHAPCGSEAKTVKSACFWLILI